VDGHRADHQRHHCVFRNAEREQGYEGRLRASVVCGFRAGNALDRTLSESARILGYLFFERV
jgi:hypothetical protein